MDALTTFQQAMLLTLVVTFLTGQAMKRVTSFGWYSFLTWPGTVLHETLHFIVGGVTNAQPVNFTVWPKKEDGYWVFGSVSFVNINNFNAVPTAMAPVLAFLVPYALLEFWLEEILLLDWWEQVGLLVLVGILCHSAFPSSQDWKVAASKPIGFIVWTGLVGWVLFSLLPISLQNAILAGV